jgi:hypothetical protein
MDAWASVEMLGCTIKDLRRRKSLAVLVSNLAEQPAISFSAAAGPAKRQAAHRIFSDEEVGISELLSGHVKETGARIASECRGGLVIAVQDTTQFDFTGLKKTAGLGYTNHSHARCLHGHAALMLTPQGLPLGVAHLEVWARTDEEYGKAKDRKKLPIQQKESYRWVRTLQTVEEQMPIGQPLLFIQDKEADIFEFMEAPKRSTTHLLLRASQPRKVEVISESEESDGHKEMLFDVAAKAPVVGRMQVTIPRAPGHRERTADLTVQTVCVGIRPPAKGGAGKKPVKAWIVRTIELEPPDGSDPVGWVLLTTLPVPDGAAACQIVRYYTLRWIIEGLHRTIKSGGCNAEQLQMEDAQHLKLALALYYITAWRLLYISYLARTQPDAPTELILSPMEIEVITAIEKGPVTTIAAAIRAIAKLGGYEPYKNGPPPGVKRLWIGLRRLEDMAEGWALAMQNWPQPAAERYDT